MAPPRYYNTFDQASSGPGPSGAQRDTVAQPAPQLRRRGPAPQLQTALLLETAPILDQLVGRASAMPFLNRKFIWLAMICVIASYISFFGLFFGTGEKIYYDIVSSGKIPYTLIGFVLRVLVCNVIACFLLWLVTPLYCDVLYGLFHYAPTKMTEWLRLIDAQTYFIHYLLWNILDYMVPAKYKWFKICLALQHFFAFFTRFLVLSAKNDIEIMWRKLIKLHLLDSCVIKSVVICELDGTIVAKTENFNVTSDELRNLIGNYQTQR